MDELILKIEQWMRDKGITRENGVTVVTQYGKMREEVAELGDALNNMLNHSWDVEKAEENANHVDLELGDVVVTAIILAKLHGTDIRTCLSKTFAKIENRKGKIIKGTFVKEEDLGDEEV